MIVDLERLASCHAEVPISSRSANHHLGCNRLLYRFHLVCIFLLPLQLSVCTLFSFPEFYAAIVLNDYGVITIFYNGAYYQSHQLKFFFSLSFFSICLTPSFVSVVIKYNTVTGLDVQRIVLQVR